ncbi:hypothetical protein F5Y09DRAFT_322804 [Xylaria sp. FL1042]|nr:hypothetical protein F5Y09DRAFT_322804 [Xylaria sp. FL1042]
MGFTGTVSAEGFGVFLISLLGCLLNFSLLSPHTSLSLCLPHSEPTIRTSLITDNSVPGWNALFRVSIGRKMDRRMERWKRTERNLFMCVFCFGGIFFLHFRVSLYLLSFTSHDHEWINRTGMHEMRSRKGKLFVLLT